MSYTYSRSDVCFSYFRLLDVFALCLFICARLSFLVVFSFVVKFLMFPIFYVMFALALCTLFVSGLRVVMVKSCERVNLIKCIKFSIINGDGCGFDT